MIFTLFYAYATLMQWLRLRALERKLTNTLIDNNALVVCSGDAFHDSRTRRSLENLLFKTDKRIVCTVVPKQKLNLNRWIAFPKNRRHFPIHLDDVSRLGDGKTYVLLQAVLDSYAKHDGDVVHIEELGELIAWKATDLFEVVVGSDSTRLTRLVDRFAHATVIDVNHELQLQRLETVDIEGVATVIKYEKKYLKEETLKYSYAPSHWNKFVAELRDLYSKIRDASNPKIKIENGSTKCFDTSRTKSMRNLKKTVDDSRKSLHTLEVSSSEHKRHKPSKSEKKMTKPPKHKLKVEKKREKSKPPNVLVFADSLVTKDNVKRMLSSILSKDKYVVYDLPTSPKHHTTWTRSTALVVACGGVPDELAAILIRYFLAGGRLLCLCSDLMNGVLHTFATAEVREHELVRFSYGPWERVEMMHHIFCYQASPAKKQFSRDSDHSNGGGDGPSAPRPPPNVQVRHDDHDYDVQVRVLGTEETWHTPSLLLAKVKSSEGRAVFSQVHLEIDPEEYENDEEKFRALLGSNEARLEILKDILSKHLDVVCDDVVTKFEYGPGYFLGRYEAKTKMMSECENIVDNRLVCEKLGVIFCGHGVDPGLATSTRLPVLIHSCPSNFSTLEYFETLATEHIGRLVIYVDVLTSSQYLLTKRLTHGVAVIPRRQTDGVGRSNNTWLSPEGSAAFSLQMHIPLNSVMGKALPLVQHLVAVAVVSAIRNSDGYDLVNLGIKWPNDLYADSSIKIGGVVVNSTIFCDLAVVNIGCGVNLSNQNPTTCINDLVERVNKENGISLKPIGYEKYFAKVFNEIEGLYSRVQSEGVEELFEKYHKYWLHGDAEVTIRTETLDAVDAKILGLDNDGYLRVRLDDGTTTSVRPDGNSFDMMSGLIATKRF